MHTLMTITVLLEVCNAYSYDNHSAFFFFWLLFFEVIFIYTYFNFQMIIVWLIAWRLQGFLCLCL